MITKMLLVCIYWSRHAIGQFKLYSIHTELINNLSFCNWLQLTLVTTESKLWMRISYRWISLVMISSFIIFLIIPVTKLKKKYGLLFQLNTLCFNLSSTYTCIQKLKSTTHTQQAKLNFIIPKNFILVWKKIQQQMLQ